MARSRMNKHLSKKQIKLLKEKMLGEVERIRTKQATDKAQISEALANKGRDEVDSANDNIMLSHSLRFSSRETIYLKKIDKTLSMIDSEEFGMCNDCGDSILFERLNARPTAQMCIQCKEEQEKEEFQRAGGSTTAAHAFS